MNGAQRIDKNDLAVDPGEMLAKERLGNLRLIGFEPAREFASEAAARAIRRRQRAERQNR